MLKFDNSDRYGPYKVGHMKDICDVGAFVKAQK